MGKKRKKAKKAARKKRTPPSEREPLFSTTSESFYSATIVRSFKPKKK